MPTKKYSKDELTSWVNSMGLPEEKKAMVLSALGDEAVLGHVGEALLMRADYDRSYSELTQEREELAAKNQRVLEVERQLIAWREENNPKFEAALIERDRLAADLEKATAAYLQKGGSLAELGKPLESPTPVPPVNTFDESKYIPRDEYEKAMKATVPALAQWTAQALQIDREHFELTGQHPDLDKVLGDVYKGKSARQAWEDTHGIAAIRATKAEEQMLARIEVAKAEERSRVLTEQAVDSHARADNGQTKSFLDGLAIGSDDALKIAQNDALSRARASKALEGFNPFAA